MRLGTGRPVGREAKKGRGGVRGENQSTRAMMIDVSLVLCEGRGESPREEGSSEKKREHANASTEGGGDWKREKGGRKEQGRSKTGKEAKPVGQEAENKGTDQSGGGNAGEGREGKGPARQCGGRGGRRHGVRKRHTTGGKATAPGGRGESDSEQRGKSKRKNRPATGTGEDAHEGTSKVSYLCIIITGADVCVYV